MPMLKKKNPTTFLGPRRLLILH